MTGAAQHLNIDLAEYDVRIRTFVPHYETMIGITAATLGLLGGEAPTIVDLGVGTGALSAKCLEFRPDAHVIGVDADEAMLGAARARLAGCSGAELVAATFVDFRPPPCDVIVACIALHHVADVDEKRRLYAKCARALRPGGMLVSADCFPARRPDLATAQREAWLAHLRISYTADEAEAYLRTWAGEDTYFPLEHEMQWMREAELAPEIVWRADGFAVIAALRGAGGPTAESGDDEAQ